jgi:uncharacterized repeat protein (TIGR01451 family)
MKGLQKNMIICLIFVGVLAVVAPQQAMAAGTASDTDIDNQATVNYSVGGTAQTPIDSNTATFKVDNKVDLMVAEDDSDYTVVVPGAENQALTFTVSNTGNTVQDFHLSAANWDTDPHGGTDNFEADTPFTFYLESGATNGFQSGEDTLVTYIDELAPWAAAGDEVTVYVVADMPSDPENGDIAACTLTATARAGGSSGSLGAVLVETAGADTAGVDIVFADGTGDTDGPTRDAAYSDSDAYLVESADLTVDKTSTVISDPINNTTDPKAIPGAIVEYTITVTNAAGAATATSITVTDSLDTEITNGTLAFEVNGYDTGKGIELTTPNLYGGAATELTNAGSDDEGDFNITTANTVTVTGIELAASEQATIKFRVEVQ